ncbi:chorismate synthase [Thermosyntropha lipolytica DSM 11003]|uniref:Chorismate synthase n=1 Tax=Thermosyntropha lipolytica DSM 11003 TaxID=1123382 RepID=A0A1M5LPA8_9FIRM|nr:chorismate synthase [Thermosyntropha lipolytica]SHG66891.1 chorismate synthase [Thermosyntropha lipolytica DSM 11003]
MLKLITSGESHGKGLVGIIEGMPAGLKVDEGYINNELTRRQKGYGRGGRMSIEKDKVEIIGGVRNGETLGGPISFVIWNNDYANWQEIMGAGECPRAEERMVVRPRPGHADLPGAIKYNHQDMRNILERASARETAARVAAGAFFKQLLACFGIYIYSQVISIGEVKAEPVRVNRENLEEVWEKTETSPVRCMDRDKEAQMIGMIERAKKEGESLGGSLEVGAVGVVPGLGSHVSWEKRLDGRLAQLIMSIPAIKAVEIGEGINNASRLGSKVHDEIYYTEEKGIYRLTNRSGGIEGGITNGETVFLRAYMKPIPTLYKPLSSIDIRNWEEVKAEVERSDICAVPAAAVVAEAMLAYGLAEAFLEKFGGDNMEHIKEAYKNYINYMGRVWRWKRI